MSTLREMAENVAKYIKDHGEVDYFLVLQGKVQDPQTGQKPGMVISSVPAKEVMEVASRGVAGVMLRALRNKGKKNAKN